MKKYLKAFNDVIGEYFPKSPSPSLDILEEAILKCEKIAVLEKKLGFEILDLFGLIGKKVHSIEEGTIYNDVVVKIELGMSENHNVVIYPDLDEPIYLPLKEFNKTWFSSEKLAIKRLTEKLNDSLYNTYCTKKPPENLANLGEVVQKLGQLEDLEEMLGMELLELFKEDFNIEFKRNDNGDIIGRSITFTRPTSPFSSDN